MFSASKVLAFSNKRSKNVLELNHTKHGFEACFQQIRFWPSETKEAKTRAQSHQTSSYDCL
jgi:hypothetical protein